MKAFYVASRALGDSILETPSARRIHEMGYELIWINPPKYKCVFECIPWISRFLSYDNISEALTEYKKEDGDIFAWSTWKPPTELVGNPLFGPEVVLKGPTNRFCGTPLTRQTQITRRSDVLVVASQRTLHRYGLDYSRDFLVEVGLKKVPVNLPPKTVVLNAGSRERSKKLHPKAVHALVTKLKERGYNPIVFACDLMWQEAETPGCEWPLLEKGKYYAGLKQLGVEFVPVRDDTVLYNLNVIAQSSCLITPDGGLLHFAVATRHPMVYLETYYPQERLFTVYDRAITIRPNERFVQCDECTLSRCKCPMNGLSVGCLTDFDLELVLEKVDFLCNMSS